MVQKFDIFDQEWTQIQSYFDYDIYNNSAWNFRYFLFA